MNTFEKMSCVGSSSSCNPATPAAFIQPPTTTSLGILTTLISSLIDVARGAWSTWSNWSSCCTNTVRIRTRLCTGGCTGTSTETQNCNLYCQYSQWSYCSITCNSDPSLSYASGFQMQQVSCSNEICDTPIRQACQTYIPCPVSYNWSPWSMWNSCAPACGTNRQQNRTRSCINPSTNTIVSSINCAGEGVQYAACGDLSCPQWSQWSPYSSCSATCNTGTQTRYRNCLNTLPNLNCIGDASQTQACMLMACPINGQWSVWSTWSSCSASCDTGIQTRQRSCNNPQPQNGGLNCIGFATDAVSCTGTSCSSGDLTLSTM